MHNCRRKHNKSHPEPKNFTRLVLAGNPNVGKSVFFNYLTGLYADVSNFPGTTVDIARGKFNSFIVEDTPGIYGVSSFNDEERVARDIILDAGIILNVVDAVHLQRDLFLTQQLIDMGKKIIVAVNMMDEASRNGIKINVGKLSALIGVPVVGTSASKKIGIEEVKKQLAFAAKGKRIESIEQGLLPIIEKGIPEPEALLILEDDQVVSERNGIKETGMRDEIYKLRRIYVDKLAAEVVSSVDPANSASAVIGRMMLKPITGIPILLLTLWLMFQFIGVFVAQTIVQVTEKNIMAGIYQPFIISLLGKLIQVKSFIGQIFIGEFGLLTMTPVYIIGLLLPLVISFYLVLSILEDSGFLPRIAVLTDRILTGVGLNGRAIIPIILGFGCITMATMTTRLLGSRRERMIATVLLGLTVPCSAQLGVIAGLLAPLGIIYTAIYCVILVLIFGMTGTALNKLLPGRSTDLLIDLPPIRLPVLSNVLKKTYTKSRMFILEAAPLFALGAVLIGIMQYTGFLSVVQDVIAPVTVWWLKLPKETANIFIMGIVRRDFGAAGLSSLVLSNKQMLTALVTITLFVPCIASVIVIFKERTRVEAVAIWLGSFAAAFLAGGLLARVMEFV